MKAKARRALMCGGMFLLAYAGGSWLGRFTTGGLSEAPSAAQAFSAEDFWEQRDKARNAASPSAPVQRIAPDRPGNHVCEGCDAGETRGRQLAQYLGLYYGSASLDEEALARAQDDGGDAQDEAHDMAAARPSVPAPPLPVLPPVRSAAAEP